MLETLRKFCKMSCDGVCEIWLIRSQDSRCGNAPNGTSCHKFCVLLNSTLF
jgi:hypothetical protein